MSIQAFFIKKIPTLLFSISVQGFSKENAITICAKNHTVYATYLYKQNNMITFDYVLNAGNSCSYTNQTKNNKNVLLSN
jgi:hypothetical protein